MNIRIFIILFFLTPNIFSLINVSVTGVSGGDFVGFRVDQKSFLIISSVELILNFIFIMLCLLVFKMTPQKDENNISNKRIVIFTKLVLILQLSFLVFNYKTSAFIPGEATGGGIFKYIFVIIKVDILFLMSLLISKDKKLNTINIIVFLLSMLHRGWIAGAIYQLIVLYFIREYSFKKISIRKGVVILILISFLIPKIMEYKSVFRYMGRAEVSLQEALNSYDDYKLGHEIDYYATVIDRFQHITETYQFVNNIDDIIIAYQNNEIIPFYVDNYILSNIYSRLVGSSETINKWLTKRVLKRDFNTHSGMLPWLLISPFLSVLYFPFLMIQVFVLNKALGRIMPREYSEGFTLYFSYLYLVHGWFGPFFMLIQMSLILILFLKKKVLFFRR